MAINLGNVCDEIAHAARVAPLVVVPADELDEVLVERDTGLGVEDGRVGVLVHVGGHDLVFGVRNDAWELSVVRMNRILDHVNSPLYSPSAAAFTVFLISS